MLFLTPSNTRIATKTTFAGKTFLNGLIAGSIFGNPAAASGGGANNPAGATGTTTLQVGSNKGDTISFSSDSVICSKLGTNNALIANADKMFTIAADGKITVNMTKVDYADATQDNYIGNAITLLDQMIANVDSKRADLGALLNRLESSIRNQSNVAANEADARSRIRDADFAKESANLSQQYIIQQAAASMLMQANTRPQLGLSLLG